MISLTERLKAARLEARIRQRDYNAAKRALDRVLVQINNLEKRIELARNSAKTKLTY